MQDLPGTEGASAVSAAGSVGCSQVDRLQNRNNQSRQPAEPDASLQSVGSSAADGSLVTFVVPEVPLGSLLRLRLDGTDLPVAVEVPSRVCKRNIITGRVRSSSLSITRIEMAGREGSGGGLGY